MIELDRDILQFSIPEVHHFARFSINFQRTLRIPDDGTDYPLPPGFQNFPLVHVDDSSQKVPSSWVEHGGVIMPMYQSEALWINFTGRSYHKRIPERNRVLRFPEYPFAIKVATGKINALTGEPWHESLQKDPQDYMVSTEQPWLDGYCVEKGVVRQFVAMPLGAGYTAEEQLTGKAQHGGLQILAYPMKRKSYERIFPPEEIKDPLSEDFEDHYPVYDDEYYTDSNEMGLAPGGRMRQQIYEDPFGIEEWDLDYKSRCFVHIVNSSRWENITGAKPPNSPLAAVHYEYYGLPWFEYYSEGANAINGSKKLSGLESFIGTRFFTREPVLHGEEPFSPKNVKKLPFKHPKKNVREGLF